mgnify:CR=1 FL=1
MKRKFLTDLGLESNLIDKIMAEYGNSINTLQSINESSQDTINNLKTQLKEYEGVNIDDLNKQISNLTKEKDNIKIDYAIESALSGVKHKELLKGQFDLSKIKLDKEGNVKGVDEQLSDIKETYKDFFESEQQSKTTGYVPVNPETPKSINSYDSVVNNADNMTAEEVANMFNNI